MRIVVVNDVSVARGGATALALLETQLLRRRGVPVTYATGDDGANPMFAALGVPVISLGEKRLLDAGSASLWRGLHNRRTIDGIGARLATLDTPDTVYHVHGWSQILSPSLFSALAPFSGRIVISAHDFFLSCPNGAYMDFRKSEPCARKPMGLSCVLTACDKRGYGHKLWRLARLAAQRRALDAATIRPAVLMIHEAMREPLRRGGLPDASLAALPNPVTAWSATRIAAERNRDFLFVGRFTHEKGPDLAARAARAAGAPLTLIGDGPLREGLREAYPEFDFPGRLAPEEVARRARTARALIMPSRYPEPYGLVAVEALWSGLPVLLGRDALLAPDMVARGAGLAVDLRDEAELVAGLLAMRDEARLAAMSRAAYADTRDLGLAPEVWADRLLSAFAALLGEASAGAARFSPLGIEGVDAYVFDGQH